MKKILLLLVISQIIGCSTDDDSRIIGNLPPSEFEVNVFNLTDRSATITWTPAKDPEGKSVNYQIFLGSVKLKETFADRYEIEDLTAQTTYSGKIIASDGEKETVEDFSFQTDVFTPKVFEGNVYLSTQAEVNEFGAKNYNIVNGSLVLQAGSYMAVTDIDDLTPLVDLIEVKEELLIRDSPLESLLGLQSVTKVGGALGINDNNKLRNLDGLEGLRTITKALAIHNNVLLSEISALQSVESIGEIYITFNENLQTISLLPEAQSLSYIYILANPSLQKIEGFEKIRKTESFLVIDSNAKLVELPAFEELVTIGGKLLFNGNDKLETIAFPKLEKIASSFQLLNNDNLNNLQGFQELRFVGGNVGFFLNPKLSDYCNLSALVNEGEMNGEFRIQGNLYNPEKEDFQNGNCKL